MKKRSIGWRSCKERHISAKILPKKPHSAPIHRHVTYDGITCHYCDLPLTDEDEYEDCQREAQIEAEDVRRSDERSYRHAIGQ